MSQNIRTRSARFAALFALLMCYGTAAQAQDQNLVGMLTDQLRVSTDQAAGGAGSIFSYAKENLSGDEFAEVARGVPDMNELLAAAPEPESSSATAKAGQMLDGGSAGGLASLASSFQSIGLDADMVSKFMPIVNQYVGSVSGEQAVGLLKGLF